MSIKAEDKTLFQFLDPKDSVIYSIPIYQREYSWKKDHCGELLSDIIENEKKYFVGSIIWVKDTNEIIDGQQRLTSLNLLLIAIFRKSCAFNEDESICSMRIDLKRMLVCDGKNRLIPQQQGKNREDFEYLINKYILRKPCAVPQYFGNRRVSQNFKFFTDAIKDYTSKQLCDLFDKICFLTFISAKVDDPQTAFTLFETMNNRGMELSAIDLIKSSYISQTNDKNSITNWETLISILGNENNQEQFLRNNYNAFRKEYNGIQGVVNSETRYGIANKATRSNVIKIYNKLVANENFMEDLTLNAKFNSLLTGEENVTIEVCDAFREYFKKFRNANATSAFMLLLFLLKKQIPFGFSEEQMSSIFEYILKFFIRRNLTNIPSTGALPQIQMDIISTINSQENVDFDFVYSTIRNHLSVKSATNTVLADVLRGDIYDSNRDMTRYLLCSLCKAKETNERQMIDFWEKREDKYIWTIEHILPEGNKDASNTPKEWIDMIRSGDVQYKNYSDQKIIELVKEYRHKIGNLTMTGYNSSLGNRPFEEKKEWKNSAGDPIGYNNGLNLNEYVYRQNAWYISNIIYRTKELVSVIMKSLSLE